MESKTRLQISVVIPYHNASQTIVPLVGSLESQSLARELYEILVVDDGSADDLAKLLRDFPLVRIIKQDNSGPSEARNRGCDVAKGDLVLFLDADTLADRNLLKTHWEFHLTHPEMWATGGGVLPISDYKPFSWAMADHLCSWFNAHPAVEYKTGPEYLPSLNFCVKREVVGRNGIRWHNGLTRTGEDVLFCRDLRRKGGRLHFLSTALISHNDRDSARAYLRHMFRWGEHAPQVRGLCPELKYGFLFPINKVALCFTIPLIIGGYTVLIWGAWMRTRPVAVTLALPQILIGRIAYAYGVWRGVSKMLHRDSLGIKK